MTRLRCARFAALMITATPAVGAAQETVMRCVESSVTGRVTAAATGQLLDSAEVTIHWVQRTTKSREFELVPKSVTAKMDRGEYLGCGIPADAAVRIRVARPGYHEVDGEIVVPSGGLRRDFQLVHASIDEGAGSLALRVIRTDSQPVLSGLGGIRSLGRDAPIVNGRVAFTGLPAGTWAVDVRSVGYATRGTIVDVAPNGVTPSTIVLAERAQVLAGMTITALSKMDLQTLSTVMVRKRVGFGTFFLPGDQRLERALTLRDLASVATGFHVRNDGTIEGRVAGSQNRRCIATLYVDGLRESPTPFLMEDILAVAMFPDMTGVPVEYRDGRNCAVVLVWTKR